MVHCADMFPAVDTRDLGAVQNEVESVFVSLFPEADGTFMARAFGWCDDWFAGRHPGYQAIDARYHDLEHTLQGTLALVRILRGRHFTGARPVMEPKMFELGLLAILAHDTGYLKITGDNSGSGAKYTLTHVRRSGEFARDFLSAQGYSPADIQAVRNMIRCTGVNVDLSAIPFSSELERVTGYALGTADLLGQMAANDYVEKLPVLYLEFAEAARYSGAGAAKFIQFQSADDLMRQTAGFWRQYVLPKVETDFGALHHYLSDPYPDGPNFYLTAIEANLAKLHDIIDSSPAR